MPENNYQVNLAPVGAFSQGGVIEAMHASPVMPVGSELMPAPMGTPYVGDETGVPKLMCVDITKSGGACKNKATVGDVCAGHLRARLAQVTPDVPADDEVLEPRRLPSFVRPITDEREFTLVLEALGF